MAYDRFALKKHTLKFDLCSLHSMQSYPHASCVIVIKYGMITWKHEISYTAVSCQLCMRPDDNTSSTLE